MQYDKPRNFHISNCDVYSVSITARELQASVNGSDSNNGSVENPFWTISKAANEALPGDVVIIHTGIYREWINPARGGESESKRIIYKSAPGEKV